MSKSASKALKLLWRTEEYSKKMLSKTKRWTSKWEDEIKKEFFKEFPNDNWTYGGLFYTNKQTITCDLYSRKLNVAIEFDGIWHFKDINGQLKHKQEIDKKLEKWCIKNNWKLIRIKNEIYDSDKFYWLDKLKKEAYKPSKEIIKFYT